MSDIELSNLIITLEKKFKKWGISILLTFLMGFGSLCYMVGVYKQDWYMFRVTQEKFKEKTEKYIEEEQKSANQVRAEKNRNVPITNLN